MPVYIEQPFKQPNLFYDPAFYIVLIRPSFIHIRFLSKIELIRIRFLTHF